MLDILFSTQNQRNDAMSGGGLETAGTVLAESECSPVSPDPPSLAPRVDSGGASVTLSLRIFLPSSGVFLLLFCNCTNVESAESMSW